MCERICNLRSGLVLVTGATGSGKSTTLASMIGYINDTQQGHIVTIEDPIEFTHQHRSCMVTQREIGGDTKGFGPAMRSVLRQDPDYVLVGEMRDYETIESALILAETGHLTFGTLHTSDAVQTINRVIDVFPALTSRTRSARSSRSRSRPCSASSCCPCHPVAVVRSRSEILMANPAVRALIRENKSHQIYSQIQTGQRLGMRTMAASLAELVKSRSRPHRGRRPNSLSDPTELRNLIRAA